MKKLFLLVVGLLAIVSFAFAQPATTVNATATTSATVSTAAVTTASEVITLKGDIIDNMCAASQKSEQLAGFIKTHTKECTLKPSCVASGYSIFADGKLSKFDKDSNTKIAEFLKKADSKLQVVVTATKVSDELSLVSIENQK